MFDQLAEAVFAGDLARAEGVLAEMHACGHRSEAIRRAKYRARPDLAPRGAPPLREPLVLPAPGAKPGDSMAGRGTWSKPARGRRRRRTAA